MFHAARALIYSQGYREKSHYCLSIALRALFIEEGKLDIQSGRDFLNAMNLREAADYEAEFSEAGAKAVIAAAEKFIVKARDLVGIQGLFKVMGMDKKQPVDEHRHIVLGQLVAHCLSTVSFALLAD